MKLDLLYEIHSLRDPIGDEHAAFARALDCIEAADRAGFTCAWAMESRIPTELADSSAPEMLLTAATQRTQNIRIGCGVTLLPNPHNHPIRIAERIATMDIVSGGRVEWSASQGDCAENEPTIVAEALEMIPRMWARAPFCWEGKHFQVSECEVAPKPAQDPHPPSWLAIHFEADRASDTESARDSAWQLAMRLGLSVLDLSRSDSLEDTRARIAALRASPSEASNSGEVGVLAFVHCTESKSSGDPSPQASDERRIVGDAAQCIRALERYREAGCSRVLILMQSESISHAATLDSIDRLGRSVVPYFAEASD